MLACGPPPQFLIGGFVGWFVAGGLAVLGPCCDRAEGVLAAARGDRAAASAAFERAITGFESLHAVAEAGATRKMLELDPQLSR